MPGVWNVRDFIHKNLYIIRRGIYVAPAFGVVKERILLPSWMSFFDDDTM